MANELTCPEPGQLLTKENGRPEDVWWRVWKRLVDGFNTTNANLGNAETGLTTKAAKEQPWSESFIVDFPDDGDYPFLTLGYVAEWTEVETDCLAGTCTLTVKIGSTPLGGTANAVSTTRQVQAHATANDMAATDDLVLTVSSNAACERMSVTLRGTRTFV